MVYDDIDFRYWINGRKQPLPGWGKYYLHLGALVAQENNTCRRLVMALAVPTRSYAAVLMAAGAIIAKAKTIDKNHQVSPEDHFETISSLPIGTSVILRQGEKAVKGIFVGTKDAGDDGIPRIGVQTQNRKGGSLTDWLPPESSPKVQVSPKTWTQLPANAGKAGDANTHKSAFIAQIFQGEDLWNFFKRSTLHCVILGIVRSLLREATETKLSVGPCGREESSGTIGDIMRIRKLVSGNEAFRSDIFPINPRPHAKLSKEKAPSLVIFDGAVGFLKWRDDWSHSNRIVVLDRTEPRFAEAVQVVNEEYLSRVSEAELRLPNPPPPSVDLVAFTVVG